MVIRLPNVHNRFVRFTHGHPTSKSKGLQCHLRYLHDSTCASYSGSRNNLQSKTQSSANRNMSFINETEGAFGSMACVQIEVGFALPHDGHIVRAERPQTSMVLGLAEVEASELFTLRSDRWVGGQKNTPEHHGV